MLRSFLILPFLAALSFAADAKKKADDAIKPGVRSPITFKASPQVSDNFQLKMRMHAAETPPPFSIGMEKFDIIVPKKYKKGDPHGLFIWVSPSDAPALSPEWEAVLAEKKLIFIGAHNSGNKRDVFARMRVDVMVGLFEASYGCQAAPSQYSMLRPGVTLASSLPLLILPPGISMRYLTLAAASFGSSL